MAAAHVPERWQGTEEDKHQMKVLGRTQETRRMFTFVSMLGFGSTLMVTWEAVLTNMLPILTNGGTAGMFWGFVIVVTGYIFVYLSLSEMASMVCISDRNGRIYNQTNILGNRHQHPEANTTVRRAERSTFDSATLTQAQGSRSSRLLVHNDSCRT